MCVGAAGANGHDAVPSPRTAVNTKDILVFLFVFVFFAFRPSQSPFPIVQFDWTTVLYTESVWAWLYFVFLLLLLYYSVVWPSTPCPFFLWLFLSFIWTRTRCLNNFARSSVPCLLPFFYLKKKVRWSMKQPSHFPRNLFASTRWSDLLFLPARFNNAINIEITTTRLLLLLQIAVPPNRRSFGRPTLWIFTTTTAATTTTTRKPNSMRCCNQMRRKRSDHDANHSAQCNNNSGLWMTGCDLDL